MLGLRPLPLSRHFSHLIQRHVKRYTTLINGVAETAFPPVAEICASFASHQDGSLLPVLCHRSRHIPSRHGIYKRAGRFLLRSWSSIMLDSLERTGWTPGAQSNDCPRVAPHGSHLRGFYKSSCRNDGRYSSEGRCGCRCVWSVSNGTLEQMCFA